MRKTLTALVLVVVACSSAETAESTSTSMSVPVTTTTTEQVAVTTTTPPTTTTTTVTTTTTTATTTITRELLEGNWADGPLVATEFGALGWWDGSGWLDAETQGALPVVGGEDYQTIRLGELGRTTAGPQTAVCPPLELIGVELADPDLLGEYPGPYGVAISAPWPLQSHLFEKIADDGTYAGFAADLLSERGLDVANPVIKQLFRTDLEGDGINEVLVVAQEVTPGLVMEEGDYSIAFMRKVVQGEVQTAVLGAFVAVEEEGQVDQFGGAHSIGGVADLNGDARMEVIVNMAFFEGFNVAIWEYVNDDIGPVVVLETSCGV